MKAIVLAGGRGTRLRTDEACPPKPLTLIGDRPILWHILKHLGHHDVSECILALGYGAGSVLAELETGCIECGIPRARGIRTGLDTATGGRLLRLAAELDDGPFFLTYADTLSDLNLDALARSHGRHGRLVTMVVVHPPERFGRAVLSGDQVTAFTEKAVPADQWINAGYFVVEPAALEYIDGDSTSWESDVLPRLADDGELRAYRHDGFWQCMDTPDEQALLHRLWRQRDCPWKLWEDVPTSLEASG